MHGSDRCQDISDPGLARFRDEFVSWLRDSDSRLAGWRDVHHPSVEASLAHGAELMRVLWDEGWTRAGWPEACGGSGGSPVLRAVVLDELWAHDIEVPHQYELLEVTGPPLMDQRPDLAAEFLGRFASGQEWWVQGLSEPEAGSDIASLRTRARRDGDGPDADFIIDGQKVWGSHGTTSTRAYILARTGTPESRHRGLTMFFVDLDTPGITVRPIEFPDGSNHVAETFLDEVRVPASRVVGEVDGGWAVLMRLLQYERGTYAWQRQAMLQRRLRGLLPEVTSPDARDAAAIGRAYLQVLAIRATSGRTIRRLAAGDTVGPETSVDKVLLGPAEHAVADLTRELRPREFLLEDSPAQDHRRELWWYSRATTIFGGAAEVQRGIVADRVLKLPAERG